MRCAAGESFLACHIKSAPQISGLGGNTAICVCVCGLTVLFLFWLAARRMNFSSQNNTMSARAVSTIRKSICEETFFAHESGARFRSKRRKKEACESIRGEWMNEAIMLITLYSGHCALTQESQSSAARPPVPPLVTLTQRGLLTLVRTDVVAQRGRSASLALISGWKVTAVFLSGEKPNRNRWSPLPETQT